MCGGKDSKIREGELAGHVFRLDCPFHRECSAVFRDLPTALLVLSPDLSICAATNDYLAATLTEEAALLGRHMFDAFPDNPEQPEVHAVAMLGASFERVRLGGARDRMGLQRYDIPAPEGGFQLRYWLPVNAPILDRDGKLLWIVHQVEDVTEYVRLREAANDSKAAEEQFSEDMAAFGAEVGLAIRTLRAELAASAKASEAKTQLIAAASHDLRQPLQAATLFAASLKTLPLPRRAEERLRRVEASLISLDRMLNDLLDLSRLESGKVVPWVQPIRLDPLLAKLADEFAPLAEAAGLRFRYPGCLEAASTDPVLLEQILRNLIGNAIKYTQRGAVTVLVTHRGAQVRIAISDTGIGIPAYETARIFEDYYQVPSFAERRHGLGIGLATVARAAKLLGHRLTVHSRVGRGSIFSIWLPAAAGGSAP
jgi:signal transduction histidine kinase